jgi:HlyD family secretion protein
MKRKTTILVLALILLVIAAAGGYAGYDYYKTLDVVTIQTGEVARQDLAQSVSANGEIKPKKSVNISSNAMGRIVNMPVKEGLHVKSGDLLISLESIQTSADVESAQAGLEAAETELKGMTATIRSNDVGIAAAKIDVTRAETQLARAKLDLDRSTSMNKEGLIPKAQYDQVKSDYDVAITAVAAAKARVEQLEAQAALTLNQRESTSLRMAQQRTQVIRAKDQLSKTTITAPLDGIITYLPVNEGEIAIIGVQNQPGTTLMTIADMSVITAEVKVDEADIVNVHVGQEAEIKVDALGDKKLKGHVSEVGNTALGRTSGQTQGNNQEAKDFKVVITLDEPPDTLRPGLSCTVNIITARTSKVLTVPIQALTVREFDDPADPLKKKKIEKEGVYILKPDNTVLFKLVKTGITGTTDIEILEGLNEKDKIVTGPYQALRSLEDNKKVKVEEQQNNTNNTAKK